MAKIEHLIRSAVTAPNGRTISSDVRWTYLSEQPFEVIFAMFEYDPNLQVECGFSRDMLERGLVRAEGVGDVHVRPGTKAVTVDWQLPEGHTAIVMPIDEIRAFLIASHRLVPPGSERIEIPDYVVPIIQHREAS